MKLATYLNDLHVVAERLNLQMAWRPARYFDPIPAHLAQFHRQYVCRLLCHGRLWTYLYTSDTGLKPALPWILFSILSDYATVIDPDSSNGRQYPLHLRSAIRTMNTTIRANATSLRRLTGHHGFEKLLECVK